MPGDLLNGVNIIFNISNDKNSKDIKDIARSLGAKIYSHMNDHITHMIFEKGNVSKLEDASSRGIHIVSPEWLINCKNKNKRVDETLYSCNISESELSDKSLTSNSTFNLTLTSSNVSRDLIDEAIGSDGMSFNKSSQKSNEDLESDEDLEFSQDEYGDILDSKIDLGPTLAENIDEKDGEESDEDFDIFESSKPKKKNNPFEFVSASQDQARKNDPAKNKPSVQEEFSNKDSVDNDSSLDAFEKDIMDSSVPKKDTENSYNTLEESENENLNALLNEMETPSLTLTNKESLTPMSDMEVEKTKIKSNNDEEKIESEKQDEEVPETKVESDKQEEMMDSIDEKNVKSEEQDEVIESKQNDISKSTKDKNKTPLRRSKRLQDPETKKEEKTPKAKRSSSVSPSQSKGSSTKSKKKTTTSTKKDKNETKDSTTKNSKKRKTNTEIGSDKAPKKQKTSSTRSKRKVEPNYKIVLSCCTKEIKENVDQLLSKFDDVVLLDEFDENATHLIIGEKKRTKKVLLAIANGKWVLDPEWINECIKLGSWVKEDKYEIKDWLKGIVKSRKSYIKNKPPIFAGKRVFIAGQPVNVSRNDLKAMIEACGGEVVSGYLSCDICITGKRLYIPMFIDDEDSIPDSPILTEDWILDSISEWKLKNTEDYLAKPKPSRKID